MSIRRLGGASISNALITNEVKRDSRRATDPSVPTRYCSGKIPDEWKPVIALHKEVYEAGLAMIKAGHDVSAP